MLKTLVFASTLAIAASAAGAASRAIDAAEIDAATTTLYVNTGTATGGAFFSQNYESSMDIHDAQVADDFVVPKSEAWIVTEVDAGGTYFNGSGPARSERVILYRNAGGRPGAVVADYDGLHGVDTNGSMAITIPATALKPGHYWVSVVANLDSTLGNWGWNSISEIHGFPGHYRNPGNAFGSCATWTDERECTIFPVGDNFFTIKGRSRTRTSD